MGARYFGASVRRLEDPKLITGRGTYVDDITIPGMLHVAFVRSPHAHARIVSIDAEAARGMPGVHAVVTAADLGEAASKPMILPVPAPIIKQVKTQYPLALGSVHFVGDTIAIVAAETRAQAEDAAAMVMVDFDPLPASVDLDRALKPGAPLAHADSPDNLIATLKGGFGDAAAIFADAPHVFGERLELHRGGCHSMECRGVVVRPDPTGGRFEMWNSTQVPYMVRRYLAQYLGLEESGVRVIAPDVGGGFGPKAVVYAEEYAIALAALHLGVPLKWIEDRREHFVATTQQRDQIWEYEVAAAADGSILGFRGTCLHDNGAYIPYGIVLPATGMASFPGPYALKCADVTIHSIFTNMVPNTPVRGAARPNTCFVLERAADLVARNLKMDPAEVRRRSFVRADQMPYTTGMKARDGSPVAYDSGDYGRCLDLAFERYGVDFRARQAAARAEGRHLGLGIGSYVEDTGLAPFEGATVRVQPDGRIQLQTGAASQGQGHKTVFAQICADLLGVRIEDVTVEAADTAAFPLGIGTVASRVAVVGGSSVHMAASEVRTKAIKVGAQLLEASEDDMEVEGGFVRVAGTDRKIALGEIALKLNGLFGAPMMKGIEPGLSATSYFEARELTFANGSNLCEVEVDVETGAVKILRYVVAHDCGRLINPMLVDGQIRGGVVHGIGNALFERMIYDESGQPLTTNYGEYLLPLATEMPRIEIVHMESPSPRNPLGVKGAGEGGTIPATAAVIAAVEDALSPFGVRITKHPISPQDIVEMIEAGRPAEAAE
jgi:carbon-monoxide dehydrogenase large subunit